jgi:hypothetical protein
MKIRSPSNIARNFSKPFNRAITTMQFHNVCSQKVGVCWGRGGERRERHPLKSSCGLFCTYLYLVLMQQENI